MRLGQTTQTPNIAAIIAAGQTPSVKRDSPAARIAVRNNDACTVIAAVDAIVRAGVIGRPTVTANTPSSANAAVQNAIAVIASCA